MSTLSSLGASSQTSSTARTSVGLVSGLNTDQIIQGLLGLEQAKISRIDAQKDKTLRIQTAFKSIETRLRALQSNMTALSRSQNSVFETRGVTVNQETLVSAAASSSATPGVTEFTVNNLARAQQVASQGFDRLTSAVTQGTFVLQTGTNPAATITIDSSNNTLQGLANAINGANAGVAASIVNDGGGEDAQSYRLVLSAGKTGVANRINITNNLAASAGGALKPNFGSTSIGSARNGANFTGTSIIQSNADGGTFTGTANNEYRFTVVQGGTVGTDENLQVSYTDATGANTGTLTINSGDVGVLKNAAQGVGVQFAAGTLVAGDTFTVKAFVPNVQEARDASVTLGNGSGALTVTNATNTFENLVPGVTLQLKAADPTKSVTLTVSADTDKMKKTIQDFVASYNDVLKGIDDLSGYNAETKSAGLLLGNRFASAIQDQVRSAVANVVDGLNPQMNRLSALGISTDNQGRLNVDDAKLSDALAGKKAGVTLADIRRLFVLSGQSGNPQVQFVTASTKTKISTTPYDLQITQAAEQATLTAGVDLAASTVIDSNNNTLNVSLDGKTSGTITLAAGTYSRQSLASAVQAGINADTNLAGRQVTAKFDGNRLVLASNAYGQASNVTINSGTSLAVLGLTAGASATGRDVVGSFTVNGQAETALGSGQFLSGAATNANTADLQLRITLTSEQIGAGLDTTVSVTRGVASRLDTTLTSLFDPVVGRLKTLNDSFDESIAQFEQAKSKQEVFVEQRRQVLLKQFIAMEQTLARLQQTGNQLTAQLSGLANKSN